MNVITNQIHRNTHMDQLYKVCVMSCQTKNTNCHSYQRAVEPKKKKQPADEFWPRSIIHTRLAMGQWSELPGELLDTIEGHLSSYGDKIRVHAVCVSWNSHLPKVRIPLPRLLQAFENQSNPTHGLFDLLEKKFDLLELPELQGKLFKGSSYGWVLAVDDSSGRTSPDVFLINPLTKVKIQLPPRYTFPDVKEYNVDNVDSEYILLSPEGPYSVNSNFVHLQLIPKVVLSSSPSSQDCIVVAIYGAYASLAWCSCNDNSWTSLWENFGPPVRNMRIFEDILFYKGRLHALTQQQLLVFENIGGPNQKVTEIVSIPELYNFDFMYLVESSDGELLMVLRHVYVGKFDSPTKTLRTEAFKVWRLDSINSSWLEVKNIGDDMLFLGVNSSLSISSRKFSGYKGNRIYFTYSPWVFLYKGEKELDSDIGVFNLEDGSFEPLSGFKCVPRFLWPPPVWVYDANL